MARATFKKGAKVQRLEENLDNPMRALRQIGAIIVAESQLAFREQKHGDTPWRPRAVPNVFGIIGDFHEGKSRPPSRRFEARPALRDTGRLAASLSWRLVGKTIVEAGSNLEYAAVHMKGGKTKSKTITPNVQKLLGAWLKKQGKELRRRLGWLLNRKYRGKELEGKVPARPFVGLTRQTHKDVHEAIGVHIMEATK